MTGKELLIYIGIVLVCLVILLVIIRMCEDQSKSEIPIEGKSSQYDIRSYVEPGRCEYLIVNYSRGVSIVHKGDCKNCERDIVGDKCCRNKNKKSRDSQQDRCFSF